MSETDKVLETEYSQDFDIKRKARMIVSFYKYGPMRENYGMKLVRAVGKDKDDKANLEKRLDLYKETGNIEYLLDVANFAMIEYMFPQHENAHFNNISESPGLGGMTYRDIEAIKP